VKISFLSLDLFSLKGKGRPNSIAERRLPALIIPVLGSQPAGDVT